MVREQIEARGVRDARVLEAMRTVRRHEFTPLEFRNGAYADHPLPIGEGQTISQPYIVALMSELLDLDESHKVLEIGTGCGYQAAVLSLLAEQVFSIEIVESLGLSARQRLQRLGYGQCRGLDRQRLLGIARPGTVRSHHPNGGAGGIAASLG